MTSAKNRITHGIAVGTLLPALLSACNFAPHYTTPEVAVPPAYKEVGDWSPAAPADDTQRGAWWAVFHDDTLNDLEDRVEHASSTLAAAVARYDQARAATAEVRSDEFPTVNGQASAARNRYSGERPLASTTQPITQNDYILGASASYELDLWGRVRNLVNAGKADEQASAADLASVRLSLQAQCADTYLQLRGFDAEIALYDETVEAYAKALDLTETRHNGGAASGIDVGRAQTQLSTARAERTDILADRARAEHAIAALIGEPASNFAVPARVIDIPPMVVPVDAPSALLQRRPDVAVAERHVAAANARIGVQKAAFFPTLMLNGGVGQESTGNGLLTAPATFWALGPAAATLPIFDAGRRQAALNAARGAFSEAAANYRATVLTAFRDVEDQMTLANRLSSEAVDQDAAVDAATRTSRLAFIQYNEGAANYLEVVTAQTAELQARRMALTINTRRLQGNVDLIRALGGGWTATQISAAH